MKMAKLRLMYIRDYGTFHECFVYNETGFAPFRQLDGFTVYVARVGMPGWHSAASTARNFSFHARKISNMDKYVKNFHFWL